MKINQFSDEEEEQIASKNLDEQLARTSHPFFLVYVCSTFRILHTSYYLHICLKYIVFLFASRIGEKLTLKWGAVSCSVNTACAYTYCYPRPLDKLHWSFNEIPQHPPTKALPRCDVTMKVRKH